MYKRTVDKDKYLYHYTSFESFQSIIEKSELRFNFFSKMNDPKESKYWSCSLTESDFKKYINKNTVQLFADFCYKKPSCFQKLKNKIQVVSFTHDIDFADNKTDIDDAYLYRGYGNPYFWSHYGNNHSGICIQFDKAKIEKEAEKLSCDILFKERIVEYFNKVYEGNPAFLKFGDLTRNIEEVAKECIINNHNYYLFTKTEFWSPENEYRIVIYNNEEKRKSLSITNSISSIIIGEDIPTVNEKMILEIAKLKKISVAKLDWGNGYPTAKTISKHYCKNSYD